MRADPASELADRVVAGDVRAVARTCRLIDDRVEGYRTLLTRLFPHTGKAWVIGITGTPGAGKSTLTDGLIREFRSQNARVAVLAVDPTSPFTGGAILGDRIRMQRHFEDPEVFIRSLATRGALGGLSRSASDLVRVLDAWGAAVILVETVGVGQDELEVTRAAHTTVVVVAPGLGDDVQAVKAGILECADVFAVNKADRDGADLAVRDLEQMILLSAEVRPSAARHGPGLTKRAGGAEPGGRGGPPIQKCIALRGEGVAELVSAMSAHRQWLEHTPEGLAEKSARARDHLVQTLRDALADQALARLGPLIEETARRIEARETDPYTACERLIAELTS